MASTSFINLTNRLLRRLNEVEITSSNFPSTVGIQSMAKDAINAAIEYINSKQFKWPFNSTTATKLLVIGQTEYQFPDDYKLVDSDSFFIQKDDTLNTQTVHLSPINRDTWENYFAATDLDNVALGRDVPTMMFKGHGNNTFGVTPCPDKAYTVQFDYWKEATILVNPTDMPAISSNYDEVITQAGLYHFYMFRDNTTQAQEAKARGDQMIDQMALVLLGSNSVMQSTMIAQTFGRAPRYSDTFNI